MQNIPVQDTSALSNLTNAVGEFFDWNLAIASRLLKLQISDRSTNDSAYDELEDVMSKAIVDFSSLSEIQYDRSYCQGVELKLLTYLTPGDTRIASFMARNTYFTQKFCDAAGVDFDAFDYAVSYLCPTYSD